MVYKQANNTNKNNFILGMAKHAHTGSRAYCYTVHNLCKCPRRLFTTTVYNRRYPTRPFHTTLYTVTVSVPQTIPYHTVHSQCESPASPFPTTLYTVTVNVQQDHSLLHCTQSMSNKTIPYHTVQSHCLRPTR